MTVLLTLLSINVGVQAFVSSSSFTSSCSTSTSTELFADKNNNNRRAFLRNVAGVAFGSALIASNGEEASASYSAYANRERDWEDRKKTGDVAFSDSKDLKRQLREVAPMNSSKSLMFCPNGPSSNVSPLMENKCDDDRMATASVFGRTEDIVGNSIPGFNGKKYGGAAGGASTSLANEVGFPKYK